MNSKQERMDLCGALGIEVTIPSSHSTAPATAAHLTTGKNSIPCAVDGCTNVFRTNEPCSPNARYICKDHSRAAQVRTAGRSYNPETDHADESVRFQEKAFDPKLRGTHAHMFENSATSKGKAIKTVDKNDSHGFKDSVSQGTEQQERNETLLYDARMRRKEVAR